MTYPGNSSLEEEIQHRILKTFNQTLDLAAEGSRKEALLGCDFVLGLDPLFDPARKLSERLEEEGEGPIPVDDLRPLVPAAAGPPKPAPPAAPAETPAAEPFPQVSEPPPTESPPQTAEPPPPPAASGPEQAPPLTVAGEPSAALDSESEKRVDELLGEGQAAFDDGEYQSAIDAWSRIFLIDIDHPEANRRIELARKLKAEVERKVEEVFHEAISHLEGGRLDEARAGFERVLEMQSPHLAAQEYLDKLAAGTFDGRSDPVPAAPVAAPSLAPLASESGELEVGADLFEPPALADLPPTAEAPPLVGPPRPVAASAKGPRRNPLLVGTLLLVLAAGGGWMLFRNWQENQRQMAAAEEQRRQQLDPIARARKHHEEGSKAIAVAQLRRLPPSHPQYEEAQSLIAEWEAASAAVPTDEGPGETELAARERLVEDARRAFSNREFLTARELFAQAAAISPLDDIARAQDEEAATHLAPLEGQLEIFRQGEWGMALRDLWRLWQEEPGNPDVQRLIVDSYYNLGVRELQRGDPGAAVENFDEALALAGGDMELERLHRFATTYMSRPEDLLYRIFVKYLPFRS